MASEIQSRLNRQGWRVIERAPDSAHPRIDPSKRRIHADNLIDLTEAYLLLRGWGTPVDLADKVARACVINYWLGLEDGAELVALPGGEHADQDRVIEWARNKREDILPEMTSCHESQDNAQLLAKRLRSLFEHPELTRSISVRHTFRVAT